MLFVDYSSAFNSVNPGIPFTKLMKLQIFLPACKWIKIIMLSHPQYVRLSHYHSSILTLRGVTSSP